MEKTTDFKVGDEVYYTSPHLIGEGRTQDNYGLVTSTNDTFVFVSFNHNPTSHACRPDSLEKSNY